MTGRRWLAVAAGAVGLVVAGTVGLAFVAGVGPATPLCGESRRAFGAMPEPAPGLRDGAELRVGEERSVFIGMGADLPAGYRLDIRGGGVLDQVRTTFVWTERRCGHDVEGYRFVVVRAVGAGSATVAAPVGPSRDLRVTVNGG